MTFTGDGRPEMRYQGKTEQDQEISFENSEDQISDIRSFAQVLCNEIGGSYRTELELQPFQPSGVFDINEDSSFSGEEKSAGKTYEFSGRVDGIEASGRLRMKYTKITFNPLTSSTGQIICLAETGWTARAVSEQG
ncbi:MAG: hypothetical protein M3P51_18105 [Chloroflexota bacterium]|nr:hypothetical protein [Chloroflexota bacterium]